MKQDANVHITFQATGTPFNYIVHCGLCKVSHTYIAESNAIAAREKHLLSYTHKNAIATLRCEYDELQAIYCDMAMPAIALRIKELSRLLGV